MAQDPIGKPEDIKPKSRLYGDRITMPYSPICNACKHFDQSTGGLERRCKAFGPGVIIPAEIWIGENDHKKPIEGDHGITFEPIEEKT